MEGVYRALGLSGFRGSGYGSGLSVGFGFRVLGFRGLGFRGLGSGILLAS